MPDDLLRYSLTAFVTLTVVVDPFGIGPIFVALTADMPWPRRRAIMTRAVLIALGVALFFLLVGRATLGYLGVSVHAFSISGGILLFATALPMLFGHRAGLQAPESGESAPGEDISVFPLAIPLLSGPGTLTTILLLASQARSNAVLISVLGAVNVVVFAITWVMLYVSDHVIKRMGRGGVAVATRVMGIVLAGLAVQFVLNGVTGYWHTLAR